MLQPSGPAAWAGNRQTRRLHRVADRSVERPADLTRLEREALAQSRLIVAALMTPGHRFPTRLQLGRAWRALRALDRAEEAPSSGATNPD